MADKTTVSVRRRTAQTINILTSILPPGTTADDVIWEALQHRFPEQMNSISSLLDNNGDKDDWRNHNAGEGAKN